MYYHIYRLIPEDAEIIYICAKGLTKMVLMQIGKLQINIQPNPKDKKALNHQMVCWCYKTTLKTVDSLR